MVSTSSGGRHCRKAVNGLASQQRLERIGIFERPSAVIVIEVGVNVLMLQARRDFVCRGLELLVTLGCYAVSADVQLVTYRAKLSNSSQEKPSSHKPHILALLYLIHLR